MIDFDIIRLIGNHAAFNPSYTVETKCPSELKCHCGRLLDDVRNIVVPRKYALFVCGTEPRVKTRKKRKVALKNYRRKFRRVFFAASLVNPLRNRPTYVCSTCGSHQGFYQAIARNIVSVDPLPMGANIIYDK